MKNSSELGGFILELGLGELKIIKNEQGLYEMTLYQTHSYGGEEGKTHEIRWFVSEELARANAKNDSWNSSFELYRVIITFGVIITERTEFIEEIMSYYDMKRKKLKQADEEREKARMLIAQATTSKR